jgi:hypothetical protein
MDSIFAFVVVGTVSNAVEVSEGVPSGEMVGSSLINVVGMELIFVLGMVMKETTTKSTIMRMMTVSLIWPHILPMDSLT